MMHAVPKRQARNTILHKTAIILLLFAVAGLSAVAKHSQYLPTSDPIHYLASATKMDVLHLPVLCLPPRTFVTHILVPEQPESRAMRVETFQEFELPQIALTASLQHRSPPASR